MGPASKLYSLWSGCRGWLGPTRDICFSHTGLLLVMGRFDCGRRACCPHAAPCILNAWLLQMRWSEKARGKVSWIAFVYRRHGQLVNVKYRSMNKEFMQVQTFTCACSMLDDVI